MSIGKRVGDAARAAIAAAFAVLALGWGSAAAGEVDCDALLKRLKSSSKAYQVSIQAASQKVRIEALGDHCVELVALWVQRELPIPQRSKGRPTQAPSPKATGRGKDRTVAQGAPSPRPTCDKKLGQFWQSRELTVEGTVFWLRQVFTIDANNDGRTDDVGFVLEATGQTDLVIRYIRTIGGVSGRTIPALRLANESDIPRLCFATITLEKPAEVVANKPFTPFKVPDLAARWGAERSPSEASEEPTDWWPEALGAAIFLVFGVGSAAILTRYCRSSPRRKAGDRRAKGRRGSGDRRKRETEGDGAADKRADQRRKGDKRQVPERRAKADRRRQ